MEREERTNTWRHGGNIYDRAGRPKNILDFSSNLNLMGLPDEAKTAIFQGIDGFEIYPDEEYNLLRQALADFEGVEKENLVCGAGAADLIYRLVYALKPEKALVTAPTFSEYEKALLGVGSEVFVHFLGLEENFELGQGILEDMEKLKGGSSPVMFLCSPNNPTGRTLELGLIRQILKKAAEYSVFVVIDECFMDFERERGELSARRFLREQDNLLILRGFTKIFAMAGLRLGHSICFNKRINEKLLHQGQPWSVSAPAQAAGIACAALGQPYIEKTIDQVEKGRDYLLGALENLGMSLVSHGANYILFRDLPERKGDLGKLLAAKGILIRDCSNYRGLTRGYYRISIKKREENERLIKTLSEIE